MFVAIDERHETFVALDRVVGIRQLEEGGCKVMTDARGDWTYCSDLPARDVANRFEEKLEEVTSGMDMGGVELGDI